MNFVKFMLEIRPMIFSLVENINEENKRIVFDDWLSAKYQKLEMYNQRRDLAYRLSDNLVLLIDFYSDSKIIFRTPEIEATGEEEQADFIFGIRAYDELKSDNIFYINVWNNFSPVKGLFYQIGDNRVRSIMTNENYSSLDEDSVILWSLESEYPVLNSDLDQLLDVFKMENTNV